MKQNFAVYVQLSCIENGSKSERDIMVFNVKAESNGGAEHIILDNIPVCTNALAFSESEMTGEYFTNLLPRCKVYDLRDFRQRCAALLQSRRQTMQDCYEEMEEARNECIELERQLREIERKLKTARDWHRACVGDLKLLEKMYGMKYSPEDVQGTA